jgi:hypothetical protein
MSKDGTTHESNEYNRGQEDRSKGDFRPTPEIFDPSGNEAYKDGWHHTDEQIKDSK